MYTKELVAAIPTTKEEAKTAYTMPAKAKRMRPVSMVTCFMVCLFGDSVKLQNILNNANIIQDILK